jgi:hypothetical protein
MIMPVPVPPSRSLLCRFAAVTDKERAAAKLKVKYKSVRGPTSKPTVNPLSKT